MDQRMTLYRQLQHDGVHFYTWDLGPTPAVSLEMGGQYAIFMDFSNIPTTAQEQVILAHEAGHVCTGSTHAAYSPYDLVARHEAQADRWAIRRLMPYESVCQAMADGLTEPWLLADHFCVTEDFVHQALAYYRDARGLSFDTPAAGSM